MSTWYEADKDDISIDHERGEVDIWVVQEYSGSIYVSVKIQAANGED